MIDENGSIIMTENQEADASGHLDNRNSVLPSVQAPPTVQGGKNMKRVLCLYRVSTPGQVDPNNDLPRQRQACQAYIDSHDDWVFSDERLEKDVSGFKLGVEKREVLRQTHSNPNFQPAGGGFGFFVFIRDIGYGIADQTRQPPSVNTDDPGTAATKPEKQKPARHDCRAGRIRECRCQRRMPAAFRLTGS